MKFSINHTEHKYLQMTTLRLKNMNILIYSAIFGQFWCQNTINTFFFIRKEKDVYVTICKVIKSISFKSSDSIGYYKKLVFALIINRIIMLCLHKIISITLNSSLQKFMYKWNHIVRTYRTLRSGKYLRLIRIFTHQWL